jgi:F-type H+-transporting ATPase subunit b
MLNQLFILAAATPQGQSGNMVANVAGKFGVEWSLLVAQIINFCIVTYLLYRFAFKPVLSTLSERQKRIEDGLKYTEQMEQKLKATELEREKILQDSVDEAKKIVSDAREQAKAHLERQTQEAVVKAESVMNKAQEAINLEKRQMLQDVRKEVANLVVMTSGKVLSKTLTAEERTRFSETAAKELTLN